jgi:hypothetical protein
VSVLDTIDDNWQFIRAADAAADAIDAATHEAVGTTSAASASFARDVRAATGVARQRIGDLSAALDAGDATAAADPFYRSVPEFALPFLVVLATAATVIASQAVITGAYSMCRSAVQLGLLPRMNISHTSADQSGQIYIGAVNAFLLIGVVWLVIVFKTSGALASAYGIAVTGTMVVTTCLR